MNTVLLYRAHRKLLHPESYNQKCILKMLSIFITISIVNYLVPAIESGSYEIHHVEDLKHKLKNVIILLYYRRIQLSVSIIIIIAKSLLVIRYLLLTKLFPHHSL